MDPKDNNIKDIETTEKEKQILSMESAIARLQGLTKHTSTEDNEKPITKATITAKEQKEDASIENKTKTTKQIDIDYQLAPNDLDTEFDEVLSEEDDARFNKRFTWLAYILFFIPLLINRKSPFVRLHANEGLDVFIIDVIASAFMICGKFIPFSAKLAIIGHLLFLTGIGLFALTTITKIFQIVRVLLGKKNQTPWLWKTRIIK